MTHLTEEQLVLYFYGEAGDTAGIATHLDVCPACRADLAAIQRTLNAVDSLPIPERGAAYGAQVWQSLSPKIRPRFSFLPPWLQPRQLAACAAVAALVIAAFFTGRGTLPAPRPPEVARQSDTARNRMLLASLSDHLERTQLTLIELNNAEPGAIEQDRARAEDLLAANRLYRLSAQRARQPALTDLLDELEQTLTEVANAQPGELRQIQSRMAQQDLLFKIRVVEARMRQTQRQPLDISSN